MRAKSKKTAKQDREIRKERNEFKAEFYICMRCQTALATDCHEIARGSYRHIAKMERVAWLCLCPECHEHMGDYSEWPLSRQLALKLLRDPQHFNLKRINEIRGRADTGILMFEVVKWLDMATY